MREKKKKTGRLILTLSLLLCTLLFSVGGLTILKGVSAGSDKTPEIEQSDVTLNDLINANYLSANASNVNKTPVKIETVSQCVDVINNYITNSAYVAVSKGKMNATALNTRGLVNLNNFNACDLDYLDWFAHEANGNAYWEEGFKMGNFYNSFLETGFNFAKNLLSFNEAQLNRFYFADDDIYLNQKAQNVNFTNDFEVPQDVLSQAPINKKSNKDFLSEYGYANSYFRWVINQSTIQNAQLIKKINGYQLEFDLDAIKGARDVYKRFVVWLPSSVTENYNPGTFHYIINLDRFGNVTSFTRDETILMRLSLKSVGLNLVGDCALNFTFKYVFETKPDSFKIKLDKMFEDALLTKLNG